MKQKNNFIDINFLKKNKRIRVILGSVASKIMSIMGTFFTTWALMPKQYGNLSYVLSVVNIFVPFLGLGLNHSLLRYGDTTYPNKLRRMVSYALYYGLFWCFVCSILFVLLFNILSPNNEIKEIAIILSIQFVTIYPLRIMQSEMRLLNRNDLFARVNVINSLMLFSLIILGYFLFGFNGIVVAYVIYPVLTMLIFLRNSINMFKDFKGKALNGIKSVEFFKYGLYTGIGSIASQLLYSMDIIMISNLLMSSVSVAIYKVGSLISINGLLICTSVMSADFVHIKKMKKDEVVYYYNNLIKKMSVISLIIVILSLPIAYFIFNYMLNSVYSDSFLIHIVLMIGFFFSFTFRIPIGNIISALGYANYNVVNAYITVLINLIFNYFLIKIFGSMGAAYATTITMALGATLGNIILFRFVIKNL